mmetsp:Transcript_62242/g.148532  ORF Transcript_62242/g.148532 Transcript_62242/m.148532 type:complete len:99 (+) Transcript_62242:1962-2258(+)
MDRIRASLDSREPAGSEEPLEDAAWDGGARQSTIGDTGALWDAILPSQGSGKPFFGELGGLSLPEGRAASESPSSLGNVSEAMRSNCTGGSVQLRHPT